MNARFVVYQEFNDLFQGDEKIIAKAFKKHSREIGVLAGKAPKEARDAGQQSAGPHQKGNALTHELHVKEKNLADLRKQSQDIAWKTYSEFEVEILESRRH
ncbi:uncharacterized protein CEXT_644411 [Caerostris extrusa]|uniref:Uncharacterized protein n=1 Tax=Caerostris extrusa TaxID=172846 RepID=A0AAV4UQE2_CAEEX|nr:uncharacterized protein CEXT_644411 [Caerostris extrusa]